MNMQAPAMIITCGAIIAINGGNAPVFPSALKRLTIKYNAKHVNIPRLNFIPKL